MVRYFTRGQLRLYTLENNIGCTDDVQIVEIHTHHFNPHGEYPRSCPEGAVSLSKLDNRGGGGG